MNVAEIHFNHDRGSATNDALNLRQDGTAGSEITAPEWVDGAVRSKPVAYAIAAVSGAVTIKVKLKGGPPNALRSIRAIRPDGVSARGMSRARTGLGHVTKRSVRFNSAGNSALEAFEISGGLTGSKVGIFQVDWNWQILVEGEWQTFATTHHRIYILAAPPSEPWNQRLSPNAGWPWVAALDKACGWAFGTTTVDGATTAIAGRINEHPKHLYDESGEHYIDPETEEFRLTNYLFDLDNAVDVTIDCTGITAVMVTFANLVGAGLLPLKIQNSSKTFFTTKPIAPVGIDWTNTTAWLTRVWGRHEVALLPDSILDSTGAPLFGVTLPGVLLPQGPAEGARIYDASMHVDQSAPAVPIKMKLGSVTTGIHYRFKLIGVGDGAAATVKTVRPVI